MPRYATSSTANSYTTFTRCFVQRHLPQVPLPPAHSATNEYYLVHSRVAPEEQCGAKRAKKKCPATSPAPSKAKLEQGLEHMPSQ
jgi:hypothetical protein